MRHVTWAAAWFVVGLVLVLGTASLLEQKAVAQRPMTPTIEPAFPGTPRTRPAEQGRQLVAVRRFANSAID
jgi:hypothetical protein